MPVARAAPAPVAPAGVPLAGSLDFVRVPRKPEDTVLYTLVQRHLDGFLAHAASSYARGLPCYVERAFRAPRRSRVAGHHDVQDVPTFVPLVEAIRRLCKGLNPWRLKGPITLPDEVRAFEEETGIGLKVLSEVLHELVSEEARADPTADKEPLHMRRLPLEDGRFQTTMDDLLARGFELGKGCESLVFVLEAARDARLIHAARGEHPPRASHDRQHGRWPSPPVRYRSI